MRRLLLAALLTAPLAALGATAQTVVLDVQNMTCELCPITVKKALGKVPGVAETKIDLAAKTATVNFDHIKRHYYFTHDDINPTRIVPIGPALDLTRPHGRERLTST